MRTGKLSLLLLMALTSCSQMLEVVQEPEESVEQTVGLPTTKTVAQIPVMSESEILHCIQSDHITMLVDGIVFQDSLFVQTLSAEDMTSLGITETEQNFSLLYLKTLNHEKLSR